MKLLPITFGILILSQFAIFSQTAKDKPLAETQDERDWREFREFKKMKAKQELNGINNNSANSGVKKWYLSLQGSEGNRLVGKLDLYKF